MKEASSELSMTAVAVVAIAAIGVVFTTLIWPSIKDNISRNTNCTQAYDCKCTGEMCSCKYLKDGQTPTEIQCPTKDTTVK